MMLFVPLLPAVTWNGLAPNRLQNSTVATSGNISLAAHERSHCGIGCGSAGLISLRSESALVMHFLMCRALQASVRLTARSSLKSQLAAATQQQARTKVAYTAIMMQHAKSAMH